MPELNIGVLQGEILPVYLGVRSISGEAVLQPPGNPTIEIIYMDPNTHVRKIAVTQTLMSTIEDGRYFYVWRIPRNEPVVLHQFLLRAVLDDTLDTASDQSYTVLGLVKNQVFEVNVQILKRTDICFPQVMAEGPKCTGLRRLPCNQNIEADIGLDDYAIEGVFRFGDYPVQTVDRRVSGRFDVRIGIQGRNMSPWSIPSTTPGGGPAERAGNPNLSNFTYRGKYRYKQR
jgi:hypothetical protein